MNQIGIYFANAFVALFFYIQDYFWYIIAFILFAVVGTIEFREKQYLFVDDERKVV